ncbi:MAG: GerMN domain-containing protein [Eubacterium sp.]|nr:GerMN domain-containing protein [Eubacterium sp.]
MKRTFNILTILCFCLVFSFGLVGCEEQTRTGDEYTVYYINSDISDVIGVDTVLDGDTTEEKVEDVINAYSSVDGEGIYVSPLLDGTEVLSTSVNQGVLTIDLSEEYLNLDTAERVLVRGAFVVTMTQIDGVTSVIFTIQGDRLKDANGNELPAMTAESFVVNPTSLFNSYQRTELTLYFGSSDGQKLVAEKRSVHYLSSVSVQKLVVEELIDGPDSSDLKATLMKDTDVISVSMTDGVCYVNFGDGFLTQNYEVSEEVAIYSVVNSLFEISGVEAVHISVNGNSDILYRDSISLDQNFENNDSLVSGGAVSSESGDR